MMEGRDEKGRFLKGKRGGPGRPAGNSAEYYSKIFRSQFDAAHVRAFAKMVWKKVAAGDRWASDFWADRIMGKVSLQVIQEIKDSTLDARIQESLVDGAVDEFIEEE